MFRGKFYFLFFLRCFVYIRLIARVKKIIDVKTKERTVAPKSYYECSVADFNTEQDCDEYAFVSVLSTMKEAWYLGKISKVDFYKTATFHKKGDIDPDNNFTFKADCYNIPISELK